jgi:hypothetical protein
MHATLLVRTALLELGKSILGNQPEAGLICSALKHTMFKKNISTAFPAGHCHFFSSFPVENFPWPTDMIHAQR